MLCFRRGPSGCGRTMLVTMRRLRTTSPPHASSTLAVLTLLGTLTACSMLGANIAAAASPPAPGSHEAGVVLDSSTNSNSNADTSRATGSNSSNGSTGSTGSTGADVPKGLESFYNQDLTWTDCTDDATGTAFQCATVTVPLDYDNPQGQTITVALKKLSSTSSSPRGSVFLNPGGPGGSGISAIESQAELYKSGDLSEVLANYDVIGFDPRGVGQSTPITCWTPRGRPGDSGRAGGDAPPSRRRAVPPTSSPRAHTRPRPARSTRRSPRSSIIWIPVRWPATWMSCGHWWETRTSNYHGASYGHLPGRGLHRALPRQHRTRRPGQRHGPHSVTTGGVRG